MKINKVKEEVEYYVILTSENRDKVLITEDIIEIALPDVCNKYKYLFIYNMNKRLFSNQDFSIQENKILVDKKSCTEGDDILIKIYMKHDASTIVIMTDNT